MTVTITQSKFIKYDKSDRAVYDFTFVTHREDSFVKMIDFLRREIEMGEESIKEFIQNRTASWSLKEHGCRITVTVKDFFW